MSEKFTYIIGAGASANALPLAKKTEKREGLSEALIIMAQDLKRSLEDNKEGIFDKDRVRKFIEDLLWLGNSSKGFATVDTFSKFLLIQGHGYLDRLKMTLTRYFLIEQLINNKLDPRYLVFLTSILDNQNFPNNIKILNWNYDFQFQTTGDLFKKEEFDKEEKKYVPGLFEYFPSMVNNVKYTDHNYDNVSLVHLNGIAGAYFEEFSSQYHNFRINHNKSNALRDCLEITALENKCTPLLTFAWENNTEAAERLKKRIDIAKKMIEDTTTLIVIGYSFPFFNRKIDKEIFNTLRANNKLRKIYFQDPILDGSFLYNQFDLPQEPLTEIELDEDAPWYKGQPIEIRHIDKVDQFYIPFEL